MAGDDPFRDLMNRKHSDGDAGNGDAPSFRDAAVMAQRLANVVLKIGIGGTGIDFAGVNVTSVDKTTTEVGKGIIALPDAGVDKNIPTAIGGTQEGVLLKMVKKVMGSRELLNMGSDPSAEAAFRVEELAEEFRVSGISALPVEAVSVADVGSFSPSGGGGGGNRGGGMDI